MEPSDFGDAAYCLVADMDEYFGAERQKDIDSRAEFDKSQMLVDAGLVAGLGVGDNAAGDGAGNLPHEHVLALGSADQDGRSLVFGAGLGKIGRQEAPGLMGNESHLAIDRIPVGMDIENAHEHRKLDTAAFEDLGFVYLLERHDLAVDARYDGAGCVARKVAAGRAEEIHGQEVEKYSDGGDGDRDSLGANIQPQRHIDSHQQDQADDQNVRSFVMYFYSHISAGPIVNAKIAQKNGFEPYFFTFFTKQSSE